MLCDTKLLRVTFNKACNIYHHIGKNLYVLLLCLDKYIRNCRILDPVSQFSVNLGSCLCKYLSGKRIHNILCQDMVSDPVSECQFLIEFVASNLGKVISSGVEEHGIDQAFCTFNT